MNPTCQLCQAEDEKLKHFLLDCHELQPVRKTIPIPKDSLSACDKLVQNYPLVADLSLVQLLIDSSVVQGLCKLYDEEKKSFSRATPISIVGVWFTCCILPDRKFDTVRKVTRRKTGPATRTEVEN